MSAKNHSPANTILTIVVGFIMVYFITKKLWAIDTAAIIGIAALISSKLAALIDKAWMKIGWALSFVVPNILLSIVFFFFLTPIALISKLFKKKDNLSLVNPKGTVFVDSNKLFDQKDFENPW